MMPLRLLFAAVAIVLVAGQYLQERRRLQIIRGLPGRQARDYYERLRRRNERGLVATTAVALLAAIGAVIWYAYLREPPAV